MGWVGEETAFVFVGSSFGGYNDFLEVGGQLTDHSWIFFSPSCKFPWVLIIYENVSLGESTKRSKLPVDSPPAFVRSPFLFPSQDNDLGVQNLSEFKPKSVCVRAIIHGCVWTSPSFPSLLLTEKQVLCTLIFEALWNSSSVLFASPWSVALNNLCLSGTFKWVFSF